LFLRIVVCFWLAMGLIVTGVIVVMSRAEAARSEALAAIDPSALATEARAMALADGLPGLRTWIRETENEYPMLSVYIVDRRNEDVLSRDLSELAEDRIKAYRARTVRRYVDDPGYVEGLEPESTLRAAHRQAWWNIRRLYLTDSTRYELIFDPMFTPGFGDFGHPNLPWLLLAFALTVSGLVCYGLARYLVLPLRDLQAGVRRLATGDLTPQSMGTASTRRDDVGVLARDVETMAARIRDLLTMKETLLRDVSHELRSPLARLQVALGLARRGGERLPVQLDRIERECAFLEEMTRRILESASLEARSGAMHALVLDPIVDRVVDDARFEASTRQVGVRVVRASRPLCLHGDAVALHSAIENVLRNALRFSPSGAEVVVALKEEHLAGPPPHRHVCVEIADRGPGVPQSDLDHIFAPFFRVAVARDRNSGGVGLGLAIVAEAVRRHGGKVTAHNRDDGPGLIVSLCLPAHDHGPAEAEHHLPAARYATLSASTIAP
jgi:two-component system sensor histidine kinase CpxA